MTEIPPIAFSYFDPKPAKFVTTRSDPIPIQVEKADVLALDAIVGGKRPPATKRPTTDNATDGPGASAAESDAELDVSVGS